MLDAGHQASDCVHFEEEEGRPVRRQYTLKGIESDTINLMRAAAGQEGMKINSWVSMRLREAAMRALDEISTEKSKSNSDNSDSSSTISDLLFEMSKQRREFEDHVRRLEREIHELNSGQRVILTSILKLTT
ncbi:hypothetical protein [Sphingobium sp. CCH11-B1]|jgi:uncharacterized protein YfeS|uniref:hypothetical protein n=1 Tax=Sphingobium sp. CCH11-B1 TaxID=1768781 RepID=UPI0012E346DF|nr:hypothetical protein [Sphingobium sp. CCH11-B1]MEA3388587.1 hypothetical protein [Pseudomonadota bacterium]